jgi:hypothetical protein
MPSVVSYTFVECHSQAETPLITGAVKTTKFTRQEVMPSSKPFTTFTVISQLFHLFGFVLILPLLCICLINSFTPSAFVCTYD